jgi:hypothetical protein
VKAPVFRTKTHQKKKTGGEEEEAKPTPKTSKIWTKLQDLDENIAYEWM